MRGTATKRLAVSAVVFLLVLTTVRVALCCSEESFSKPEKVAPDFSVHVRHDKKPIAGVAVELTVHTEQGKGPVVSSGVTDEAGVFRVRNLAKGRYWLSVHHAGISAGVRWLEVVSRGHRSNQMEFEWAGPLHTTATRRISGTLREFPTKSFGSIRVNLSNQEKPVNANVPLKLENAHTGETHETSSDKNGAFRFENLLPGTYVLHIESAGTNLAIKLDPSAKRDSLPLVLTYSMCGSGYQLEQTYN